MNKPWNGIQVSRWLLGTAGFSVGVALMLSAACQSPPRQATPVPEPVQQGSAVTTYPAEAPPAVVAATQPAESPPCEQSLILGESLQGRPIELYVFGQGGETTLIIGGIHGNEFTTSEVAFELIAYLREHPQVYASRCIMIAPAVNPDGLAARTRGNANRIDINRNFPAKNFPRKPDKRFGGGREPLSEPETQAIRDAIEHARPAKIISIHSIKRGRHGNNYDGPAALLAEEMGHHNGYPVLSTMGYPTPGSLGSWAGVDRGIPTITLELPRDADGATCWAENREALLAAIRLPLNGPLAIDPPMLGK